MPALMDRTKEDFAFEMPQEVLDKIEQAEDTYQLISEEMVQDLSRVNVRKPIYCKVKRIMDILLSAVGLLLLVLPTAVMSAIVYVNDPGPVFFSQYRVGRKGKRFKMFKFRTMRMDTPKYLSTMELEDPDRYLTKVGRVLRKLSLDEIPQLFNVLKGDMSLVGPRPLISDEYEIHAMRTRFGVYSIRPGITGLAQINGRDLVSPADKVRWDVRYLQDFGFWMDMKILFSTLPKALSSKGIVEGYKEDKCNKDSYETHIDDHK